MRIAVCLSGQPRHLDFSLPTLQKNLISFNPGTDIFFHSWWDESLIGTHFDSAQPQQIGSVGLYQPDTLERLKSLEAKKFLIEKPKIFPEAELLRGAPTAKPDSMCSVFYSQWKSGILKREYELENGFKYDIVVRARLDIVYGKPLNLNEFIDKKDSYLILSSKWQDIRQVFVPGLGEYTMDDNFAISNSDNMDKFFDVYPRLVELNKIVDPPFAENYLGWNCKMLHNLKVMTHDFDIEIAQRIRK